jgi:hypothetical protein
MNQLKNTGERKRNHTLYNVKNINDQTWLFKDKPFDKLEGAYKLQEPWSGNYSDTLLCVKRLMFVSKTLHPIKYGVKHRILPTRLMIFQVQLQGYRYFILYGCPNMD